MKRVLVVGAAALTLASCVTPAEVIILSLSAASLPLLAACGPRGVASPNALAGDAFVGSWASKRGSIEIKKNGASYIGVFDAGDTLNGPIPLTYADSVMKTNTSVGDIALTDNNQTLVFAGDLYHRAGS